MSGMNVPQRHDSLPATLAELGVAQKPPALLRRSVQNSNFWG